MKIPFYPLDKIQAAYQAELLESIQRVIQIGQFVLGKEVQAFEEEFAQYCGQAYGVGVGNGLDALRILFECYIQNGKIKRGDKVLVSAHTFYASWLAIEQAGLVPVPVEPDLTTYNLDPAALPEQPDSTIKALLVVHMYGQPAEMDLIQQYCHKHKLLLFEDAAQAHGARYKGKKVGSLGHAAAFSFYPSKNLGALGDGGMLLTSDKQVYEFALALRNYGGVDKNHFQLKGWNSRLDELQAAVLRLKLKRLDEENKKRQEIANFYLNRMANQAIQLPQPSRESAPVWHQFVIRCSSRDRLKHYLTEKDITTQIHYLTPVHQQAVFSGYDYQLSKTEQLSKEVLSLPIHPALTEDELQYICACINSFTA